MLYQLERARFKQDSSECILVSFRKTYVEGKRLALYKSTHALDMDTEAVPIIRPSICGNGFQLHEFDHAQIGQLGGPYLRKCNGLLSFDLTIGILVRHDQLSFIADSVSCSVVSRW